MTTLVDELVALFYYYNEITIIDDSTQAGNTFLYRKGQSGVSQYFDVYSNVYTAKTKIILRKSMPLTEARHILKRAYDKYTQQPSILQYLRYNKIKYD